MKFINGQLIDAGAPIPTPSQSISYADATFLAYNVELIFDVIVTSQSNSSQTYRIAQRRDAVCDEDGAFVIEIEDDVTFADGVGTLVVTAPNGQQVYSRVFPEASLDIALPTSSGEDSSAPITIDVTPVRISLDDGVPSEVTYLTGRIVQFCGTTLAEGSPVLVWGCRSPTVLPAPEGETPTSRDDDQSSEGGNSDSETGNSDSTEEGAGEEPAFRPPSMRQECQIIASSNSRADGTFRFDPPTDRFDEVWVQWGRRADQIAQIPLGDDGAIPTEFSLVEAFNAPAEMGEEDCGCSGTDTIRLPSAEDLGADGGEFSSDLGVGCQVQFKPNRTLEEFAFCSFVRTTEPEIMRDQLTPTELSEIHQDLHDFASDFRDQFDRLNAATSALSVREEAMAELEVAAVQEQARPALLGGLFGRFF